MVLAGIGVGVAASMAGCTNPVQDYVIDPVVSFFGGNTGADRLEGETTYAPPEVLMGEAEPIEVDGGIVEPVSECGSEEIIELDGDVEYIPEAGEIVSEEEENISEEEDKIQEDGNINQEE